MRALKLLIILVLPLLLANTAFALSCAPTFPKIGVISDFSLDKSYYTIILDNVQSFETSNIMKNNFCAIDEYETIVGKYVNDEKLLEQPEHAWSPNSTSMPKNAFEKIEVDRGDILIQGPPSHVCSYRFFGIFSPDGQLKYVVINDAFSDYSYNEYRIEVTPGKEIDCENDYYCKVQVDYKVANEKFTLTLDQSYSPKVSTFNSFRLLDSSDYKQRDDDTQIFDWGIGKHLTYVIEFSDSSDKTKCVYIKKPDEKTGCQYFPIYDSNNECIIDYQEKCEVIDSRNIFQKFINWIISFFS
ncbi:hypothetical protein HYV50_05100 [Candidatus Pacearchaeota archaeon]|nr:hypothetical protein [Candidatus Pacearchaeota archaeon]